MHEILIYGSVVMIGVFGWIILFEKNKIFELKKTENLEDDSVFCNTCRRHVSRSTAQKIIIENCSPTTADGDIYYQYFCPEDIKKYDKKFVGGFDSLEVAYMRFDSTKNYQCDENGNRLQNENENKK